MVDQFFEKLDRLQTGGYLGKKYISILRDFYKCYLEEVDDPKAAALLFLTLLGLIEKQAKEDYKFEPYHKKVRTPFDYYSFGIQFLKPLVAKDSKFSGAENLVKMQEQLRNQENVILFSNHQTESDPQMISILLENDFPELASKIIYVAGERVVSDPLAIPFSLGCDLLCIYSKKYIDSPPELKRDKQLHNQKTMELMSSLLKEGGKIIYVAPSGGRDRPNEHGEITVALFDPQSIEMFHLMAKKSSRPTHFYPLSLFTYNILPPPDNTQVEMGEKRRTKKGKIFAYFGEEIDMEVFPGSDEPDKISKRRNKSDHIYNLVKQGYETIRSL
jgi:glycerol-3-phosphate O-acyltransferase